MSKEKAVKTAVEARYTGTVPSLLREAGIYRRKCSKCKGTGVINHEIIIDGAAYPPCVCSRCEGDGFRYSMGGEKQSPSFARITVASMAKRSIVPYLDSLKPSAVKRVKDEVEREIDNLISSFTWTASSPKK